MGQLHGVDPLLIAAVCMTESSGRPHVTKFEVNYPWLYKPEACARKFECSLEDEIAGQSTSYGFMQVMGAVMREYGFAGSFDKAFEAETNIDFGTKHLANFLKKIRHTISDCLIQRWLSWLSRWKQSLSKSKVCRCCNGVLVAGKAW